MNIYIRPMTADEVWDFLLKRHKSYHTHLKKFGYRYNSFIPNNEQIHEMFSKETLTDQDIAKYKDVMDKLYNVEKLQRLDGVFENEVKPMFENIVNKVLSPVVSSWGTTLPKNLEILCTYGQGGSYRILGKDKVQIIYRMSRVSEDNDSIFGLLFHEFVHTLIEIPIIKKYNVPQDLKERIVDLICWEFCRKPVQKMFENSFANAYITVDAIKTDLPGAVAKMMTDYNALNKRRE